MKWGLFSILLALATLAVVIFTDHSPDECWHGQRIRSGDDCNRIWTSNGQYVR